jgi:prepilin-type N-terminal cleavage/methylation domain-containing protein
MNPPVPPGGTRGHAAFTLFELLLAVAIFAVVLLAIQSVFFSALSLRNRTVRNSSNRSRSSTPSKSSGATWPASCRPVGHFPGPCSPRFSAGGGLGPSTTASTNSYRANLPGAVVSPELYTATGIIDDQRPWGEIMRVTYYLADPTNNSPGRDLIRAVTRNLLPIVEDQPEHQWLLGGVDHLQFLFFDGLDWIDVWDSTTAATPLPSALKIQLWLTSDDPAAPGPTRSNSSSRYWSRPAPTKPIPPREAAHEPGRHSHRVRPTRQGSILIIVLWIAFGLVSLALYFAHSMTFELRAADNRTAGVVAEEAIAGAAVYLSNVLASVEFPGQHPDPFAYDTEGVPPRGRPLLDHRSRHQLLADRPHPNSCSTWPTNPPSSTSTRPPPKCSNSCPA